MAIKRYSIVTDHVEHDEVESLEGSYVHATDHIDSHRFDEEAERVRFENKYGRYSRNSNGSYCVGPVEDDWQVWLACALAREKEFVG